MYSFLLYIDMQIWLGIYPYVRENISLREKAIQGKLFKLHKYAYGIGNSE